MTSVKLPTSIPSARSASTEADAMEIEQPAPSHRNWATFPLRHRHADLV